MSQSIQSLLRRDSNQLQAALSLDPSSARIEVQCLLQSVLRVNRAYLLTHPERMLGDDEAARYGELFVRRLRGEPVAYLLGVREFYGLEFKVTPDTLIPRPDTELLVEQALQRIPQRGACRVLDLGAGSGAIAIAIAHARVDAEIIAVDASPAALEIARFNAQHLKAGNVRLLHSDWFAALAAERFDLIVSNPPYIAAADVHLSIGDVRFEPLCALASGEDGLDDIRRIIAEAQSHLCPGGWLMFEHGYDQAKPVRLLMRQAGFAEVASSRDLSGIERVTAGRLGVERLDVGTVLLG